VPVRAEAENDRGDGWRDHDEPRRKNGPQGNAERWELVGFGFVALDGEQPFTEEHGGDEGHGDEGNGNPGELEGAPTRG
jgi:hypothetical protein